VVCATHRNLPEMVEEGAFREDLMFRINTFEIQIPPLRSRVGDIELLARHLYCRFRSGARPDDNLFTAEAVAALQQHVWPGNVRELANVVEHATILCDRPPVDAEHLPRQFTHRRLRPQLRTFGPLTLRQLEEQAIEEALERNNGNKTSAAEELGVSVKTLYNKLNQAAHLRESA
jgi:two-component system NtrC family response regulator